MLKGGPGTGKSSFMKKVSNHFYNKGFYVEEIYCSSDPRSLDGVIVSNADKRIAVLDGTAPHERDAIIPGAIDELINLGDGWDERLLSARRNKILSLVNEKSKSYKTAYFYLSAAGKSYDIVSHFYKSNFDVSKAKIGAEGVLKNFPVKQGGEISTRLISSFGRYGEYSLNTLNEISKDTVKISGNTHATDIFMKILFKNLVDKGANIIRFPRPFNPDNIDAIYLPDISVSIVRADEGELNSDEFINLYPADRERIRAANRTFAELLEESKRWFAIASDMHFRLEEIYGEAMNFEKNNEMLNEKIKQIENILENI